MIWLVKWSDRYPGSRDPSSQMASPRATPAAVEPYSPASPHGDHGQLSDRHRASWRYPVPPAPDRPCVLSEASIPPIAFTPLLSTEDLYAQLARQKLAGCHAKAANDLLACAPPPCWPSPRGPAGKAWPGVKRGRPTPVRYRGIYDRPDQQQAFLLKIIGLSGPPWSLRLSQFCVQGNRRPDQQIRYDEAGTAFPIVDVEELSLDAFVADLEACRGCRWPRAIPMFGMSQGSPVAVAYAVRHPERVAKLVRRVHKRRAPARRHRPWKRPLRR